MQRPACNYTQSCLPFPRWLPSVKWNSELRPGQPCLQLLGRRPCPLCGSFSSSREISLNTTSLERPSLTRALSGPSYPSTILSSLQTSRLSLHLAVCGMCKCWLTFISTGTSGETAGPSTGALGRCLGFAKLMD